MTTLICPCGSRLNIRGMQPGKAGRCPSCGGPIRVPGPLAPVPAPAAVPVVEDEWNWEGSYGIEETPPPEAAPPPPESASEPAWSGAGAYHLNELNDLPPPPRVEKISARPIERREPRDAEPWFPPPLLMPARGMEGVVLVVALGGAFWVAGTLVPEYCLGVLADAEKMSATPMGYLVMLITATPLILLSPLVGLYWFQYLGRILINAAEGERTPPRPPDRNADGLFTGLAGWLGWLGLGLGVGSIPVAVGSAAGVRDPILSVALGLIGLPYALMALLLTFLHDEDLAARPWRVVRALGRVGPSFLIVSLVVAGLLGSVGVAFWALLKLRDIHFWVYVLLGFPCWCTLIWMTFVAQHTLGAYYSARKHRLRWRRPEAWWNAR